MVPRSPEAQSDSSTYRARGGVSNAAVAASQTLTSPEAAEYIGLSDSWMRQSRMPGRVGSPPFLRCGRSIRYLRADLDRWLEQRRCSPGGEPDNVQHRQASEPSVPPRRSRA